MDDKVAKLIFEYFKMDVLQDVPLKDEMKREIIEVFTQVKNEKKGIGKGRKNFLTGTNIEKLRTWIIENNSGNYKPYSVKLGMLRPELRAEACEKNISLQKHIVNILRDRKKD